jgi:hypothetical protein
VRGSEDKVKGLGQECPSYKSGSYSRFLTGLPPDSEGQGLSPTHGLFGGEDEFGME